MNRAQTLVRTEAGREQKPEAPGGFLVTSLPANPDNLVSWKGHFSTSSGPWTLFPATPSCGVSPGVSVWPGAER